MVDFLIPLGLQKKLLFFLEQQTAKKNGDFLCTIIHRRKAQTRGQKSGQGFLILLKEGYLQNLGEF